MAISGAFQETTPPLLHSLTLVFVGLTIECIIRGILLSFKNVQNVGRLNPNILLVLLGNLASLGLAVSSIYLDAVTESDCVPLSTAINLFYHAFFVVF
ncbi:hypothetical protein HDU98_005229, partial [Podochytrium sp. JEL0797]